RAECAPYLTSEGCLWLCHPNRLKRSDVTGVVCSQGICDSDRCGRCARAARAVAESSHAARGDGGTEANKPRDEGFGVRVRGGSEPRGTNGAVFGGEECMEWCTDDRDGDAFERGLAHVRFRFMVLRQVCRSCAASCLTLIFGRPAT